MSIIEILLTLFLTLIVSLTVIYFIVHRFLQFANQQKAIENKKENLKLILPLKLQAYERLILFLERINPYQLVIREAKPDLPLNILHLNLINSIREEFEHNLSQQLYVSIHVWELVKNAKEEIIQMIHKASVEIPSDSDSALLAGEIFELSGSNNLISWQKAVETLHKEFTGLYE